MMLIDESKMALHSSFKACDIAEEVLATLN